MQRCNELEADLAELRAAYDLYFNGVERLPPHKKHDAFKKGYQKLKGSFVRQTAAKFRIESIGQKLLTYERLWDRTLKEIENGTFKRDLLRIKRKDQRVKERKTTGPDADFDVDEDLDLSDLDDEGDGDLSAALAAAEAAASRPALPSIKPVGLVPAITPVTPPGGSKPASLAPAITPVTPAGGVRLTPAITAVTPPGGVRPLAPAIPAVTPPGGRAAAPKITSGSFPAITPSPGAATPAARPPSRPPVTTGSNPALKSVPPAPAPARAASGPDGGLSDTKIKAIYDAYVMAKKRCGEDTRAVTLDSVSSSLKKQVPELMKSHNARSVEFKVVIKDGKAVLRALPKD